MKHYFGRGQGRIPITLKGWIEIPKNAILRVRVVSDQLCDANGPLAQVQRDELATRLSFRDRVEFLEAVVFVLRETLAQLYQVKL